MIMYSALHLLPQRRALAIHAMTLVCGVALFTLGGYVQATEAVGARASASNTSTDEGIRPFRIHVSEAQLDDLRKRIAATRWPDEETVSDDSQGIRLAEMQALVRYWGNGYNWRNGEAKLNALPEFVTTIDGVDIQFIHVRSREPNALPLILTHGWPGSPLEFLKVIGPLTDPVAHGGRAQDAFDVVIPAIPGYGFSGKPTDLGWNPERVIGRDEILDDITLYWLTNTGASSSRFYWENNNNNFSAAAQKTNQIKVPVAITVFPHEIYRAPESWSRQAYPSLYYFHEAAKGGHFAAWEQPQLFAEELRAAFKSLR